MDIQNRNVIARCFVKGPTEGSFAQFGGDINLGAGGNSDSCDVNDSVLTEDGDYVFKVMAYAGGDEADSGEVAISYDGTGPERPKSIEKDKDGSCKYEIKVETHPDGETAYVEVYKSDEKKFTVNDANRIKTINMGPDEEAEFVDEFYGDDCGTTYYYAVRAFDLAGNPSDVRGETIDIVEIVEIENEGTEETVTGAIPTGGQGGSILGTSEDSTENASEDGTDLGDILGEDEEGTEGEQGVTSGLGKLFKSPWTWILLILLAIFGFGVYSRKRNDNTPRFPK